MVLETYMKLFVRDSRILWKNVFVPKIGKMDQKWPKNGFFEIIVKLGS